MTKVTATALYRVRRWGAGASISNNWAVALSATAFAAILCSIALPSSLSAREQSDAAQFIQDWQRFVPASEGSDSVVEADLWQRVREGFAMDLDAICDADTVAPLLRRYEERTGIYLERILLRARPYLHYIAGQLQKRGLPLELAILPVVESAYDPFAYSPGKAAGLWQFISHTGELFGLHSDWWRDDRHDIRASTDAALSYLTKLHSQNRGDWLLAMSSYNAGLGAVRRAVSYVRSENTVLWRQAQKRFEGNQRRLRKAEARVGAATRLSAATQTQLQEAWVKLDQRRAESAALTAAAAAGRAEIEVRIPSADGEAMTVTVLSTGADGIRRAEQAVTEAEAQLDAASVAVQRALEKTSYADEQLLQVRADSERKHVAMRSAKARFERWPTFWELSKLPQETRNYIPKFCAIAQIVATPARYGLTIAPVPDRPYFAEVDIGAQIDLALAAELAGIDTDILYRLNPSMRRWATPPDGPHRLLVPTTQRALMEFNLAQLPPKRRLRWVNHELRKGEGLGSIARHYHTTVEAIQRINSLPDGVALRLGDELLVMAPLYSLDRYALSEGQQRTSQTALRSIAKQQPVQQRFYHVVRNGESLWSISRQYGIGSYDQIAIWNHLDSEAPLQMGARLSLWVPTNITQRENSVASAVSNDNYERVTYKVRSGDSLSGIAQRFGVDIRQIAKWNSLDVHQYIQPQQILVLYPAIR